jgi:hypothetical protein
LVHSRIRDNNNLLYKPFIRLYHNTTWKITIVHCLFVPMLIGTSVDAQRVMRLEIKTVALAGGPLNMPGKVGYRFRPFWALRGGPKSTKIRVSRVDRYPTFPKKEGDGWTSVPNLKVVQNKS